MLIWCLLNHAWFQFLNPLPISSFLAPFSSLFVFPHVLLITIGKIIFPPFSSTSSSPLVFASLSFLAGFSFFLSFSFLFLIFPLLHFRSSDIVSYSSNFLYICFLSLFFSFFFLFCCFNPFSHSLALLSLSLSSLALLSFHLSISSFLLFPLFLPLLLFHFISLLHNVMISSVSLAISLFFLLLLLFILLFSLLHFRSSNLFLFFRFLFCLFTSNFSSFSLFQPSFPHSWALLNLNLSSPRSSSSIPTSFLLFLFSPSFSSSSFSPFFLFSSSSSYAITTMWWFPQFPCHFLGAVLPAPALYPSLIDSLTAFLYQKFDNNYCRP